jgi:hypothetical protein
MIQPYTKEQLETALGLTWNNWEDVKCEIFESDSADGCMGEDLEQKAWTIDRLLWELLTRLGKPKPLWMKGFDVEFGYLLGDIDPSLYIPMEAD